MRTLTSRAKRGVVVVLAAFAAWIAWIQPNRRHPVHQAEYLNADGLRLRALRAGKGDTTLVFLHGYGESLLSWRLVLDRFTSRFRVLAVDLPGFGLSDKPDGPYTTQFMESVLSDLIAHSTTGPLVVVGHSLGGQLAAQLALDHPDRVIAAVLIAPGGAGISPLLGDTTGVAFAAARWVASAAGYVLPVHDQAWLGETRADAKYLPSEDSLALAASRKVLDQFDFSAINGRYADLNQPVLLIWGRNDPTIPLGIGERIAGLLPCRRFVVLSATLHRPQQTNPDTVATEMLQFLDHPTCDNSSSSPAE
ncbi:MAG TPA: alpha/beta hydrolase [Gemmatimonadales bacterium]|nr:alpha/beta hydrolase [Gemmatimonadales bacterium]